MSKSASRGKKPDPEKSGKGSVNLAGSVDPAGSVVEPEVKTLKMENLIKVYGRRRVVDGADRTARGSPLCGFPFGRRSLVRRLLLPTGQPGDRLFARWFAGKVDAVNLHSKIYMPIKLT